MIITLLPDKKRLHLQHGPIDLIIEAFGAQDEIARAYHQASERFQTVLDELVDELPLLRSPLPHALPMHGTIAQAMAKATQPHADEFITPMAAVAGAVADEILKCLCHGTRLDKAYVNNGGDIALYISPHSDEIFRTGIVTDPRTAELLTTATIVADSAINGIATSGRHGRSHSLGIADCVTVFAASAAMADAAATIIANKVDLSDCEKIVRQPARHLAPDSDLGNRLVTVDVGQLSHEEKTMALDAGQRHADYLCQTGVIKAAYLSLQSETRIIDGPIDVIPAFAPHSNLSTIPKNQNRIAHA